MLPFAAFAEERDGDIPTEENTENPLPGEDGAEEGDPEAPEAKEDACLHEPAEAVSENAAAPTCTEPGSHDEVVYCALCGEELSRETVEDPAPGHTPEDVDEAASTCVKPGHTAGKICSVCGAVLEGCDELPLAEHTPGEAVSENKIKPTCTEPGSHDAAVYCTVCEKELSRETVTDPAPGHTPEDVDEVPAEPGKPGTSAGKKCAVCGEVLEGCEVIEALPTGETEPEDETVITIKTQPKDAEPKEGTAGFSVSAEVSTEAELAYQWQRLDESAEYENDEARAAAWEDIEDETGTELRLEKLDDPDALAEAAKYAYRCVLTAGETGAVTDEARQRKPASGGKAPSRGSTVVDSGYCGDPSVNNGEDVTWTLTSDGLLTISGSGAMADYSYDGSPWYSNRDTIRTVTLADGVTSIGDYAFSDCSGLTGVTFPEGVTSIGGYAFSGCSGLTGVTIPASVTSIGNFAFAQCSGLTSVTIPSSVTTIGSCTFAQCSGLASVTIPEGATSIGSSAFRGCSSLTSITIPSSVTTIGGGAFAQCSSLTSITIPSSVTTIGAGTFNGSGLTSVTIPSSVTSIGSSAFSACNSLADVYYLGSSAQWEQIVIGNDNVELFNANIHYNYAPTITQQPQDMTVSEGAEAYMTISATGSNLTYRWQLLVSGKWTNCSASGYNTARLKLTTTTGNNGRKYRCIVSSSSGSVTSGEGILYVQSTPVVIRTRPQNMTANEGSEAYMTISATGSNLKYRWQLLVNGNWTDCSAAGHNTARLKLTTTAGNNGRKYRCIVSSGSFSVTSNSGTLTVRLNKPVIKTQPQDMTVNAGAEAYMTISATGSNLSYRWQLLVNGSWTDCSTSGYNTARLKLTTSAGNNGRKYRCIVSDSVGSVTSNPATLTVIR